MEAEAGGCCSAPGVTRRPARRAGGAGHHVPGAARPGQTERGDAMERLSAVMSTAEAVSVAHAVGLRGWFLRGEPGTAADLVACLAGTAAKDNAEDLARLRRYLEQQVARARARSGRRCTRPGTCCRAERWSPRSRSSASGTTAPPAPGWSPRPSRRVRPGVRAGRGPGGHERPDGRAAARSRAADRRLHRLPRRRRSGTAHGRRSATYSPEWVALTAGRRSGAELRFIDLPAWHPALADGAQPVRRRRGRATPR